MLKGLYRVAEGLSFNVLKVQRNTVLLKKMGLTVYKITECFRWFGYITALLTRDYDSMGIFLVAAGDAMVGVFSLQ